MPAPSADSQRPQVRHPAWPGRAAWLAASALAGAMAAAPALAQGSTSTAWSFKAQIEDLDTPETLELLEGSGIGDEFFHTPVDIGPNGTFNFIATPEVVTSGDTPQLKSMTSLVVFGTVAGRGVRAMGQASAGLSDTFTVTAAPDFAGGYLSFQWGVEGSIWANVISSAESSHLRFVGWEQYQEAALSVSGPGLPQSTLAKYELSYTSAPVTPEMANFEDYLEWNDGPLLFEDEDRIEIQQQVGGGSSHAIAVALQPGVPVALSFELRTGINMGIFNVDNGEVFVADHGMDFGQTATLQGLRLMNTDGTPYAGTWSLESASGIDYALLPVPEPPVAVLALAGLMALVPALRRRRMRS